MDVQGELRHVPARNEVVHAYSDHSKARRMLGMEPRVPLAEGLKRMADWAKDVGVRSSPEFDAIEVARGLPQVWLEG
jgi:UDP-glucose 4-epimerase